MRTYKHVDYLWDADRAKELSDDQVALLLYRSNLLGSDLRITNYGGGNTSCRVVDHDPLTGEEVEVMWIKGSGGDIGTLKKSGLAARVLTAFGIWKKYTAVSSMKMRWSNCSIIVFLI